MLARKTAILFSSRGQEYSQKILYDAFLTDEAAPLASPRTAEPGPGQLTLVQTGGQFSIAYREMLFTVGTTFGAERYIDTTQRTRLTGLALTSIINRSATTGNGFGLGWFNSATPAAPSSNMLAGIQAGSTLTLAYDNLTFIDLGFILPLDTDHEIWSILRSTGSFLIINNVLEWVSVASSANAYAGFTNSTAVGRLKERFEEVQFINSSPYTSDYGIATNRLASPVANDTTTSTADGLIEFTWTPAAAEVMELSFRRTDDNNRYILRCDQAAGIIRVYKVEGGVETERTGGTTTQTWTIGTAWRIVLKFYGTTVKTWVANTNKNATTTTSFNQSATGVMVAGFATGSNLVCWPRTVNPPVTYTYRYFLGFGDSKTALGQYQMRLRARLLTSTGSLWRDITGLAISGYTAALWASEIDARLATITQTPEFILFDLGTNELDDPLPAEATWKANIRYIWRALHTRWSSVPIRVMLISRNGYTTQADSVDTWLGDLQAEAEFSPYVSIIGDERVWLPANTGDGVHPNAAGYVLMGDDYYDGLGL